MQLTLPHWNDSRFEIPADTDLLEDLISQMQLRGGALKPASGWQLPDELVHAPIDDLLDSWCGGVGQMRLSRFDLTPKPESSSTELLIFLFERYLRNIDHAGLLNGVTLRDLANSQWRVFDLGSLIDFLLLSAFVDFSQPRPVILEIGGGFGRLAEFLMMVTGRSFRYINIDAVPVSIMYCRQYLKAHFPDKNIAIFDEGSLAGDFDVLIVPAWNLDKLPTPTAEVAVNIESMQEMDQGLVDFYISYLDNAVQVGGLIVLINSRQHLFQGKWSFPETWQCLFRHRMPRAWSINHPTEIFRKTLSNNRGQNMLRNEAFRQEQHYARIEKNLLSLPTYCIPNMLGSQD